MKYPIYNRFAYLSLSVADFLLSLLPKRNSPALHSPKRILVCNIAHLGDVIITTTLLPALKELYPDAKIGMLVARQSQPVLQDHPMITWMHTLDHWKITPGFRRYISMRKIALEEIQKVGYEMAIDCRFHFPNCAPLLWQANIPVRIGFKSAGFSPLLTRALPWNPAENRSAVEAFFSLLPKSCTLFPPNLPIQTADMREDYLVIHIGSEDSKKEWPLKKWRELSKNLIEDGYELYFTGKGERQAGMIQEVIDQLPQTHNLCDCLSWNDYIEVIQKASLLVGVDTSAGHVAAAVDTPAILLFTGIHPPQLWRPFNSNIHVLTKPLPCSSCLRGCSSMRCIREIAVKDVYDAVRDCSKISHKDQALKAH